MARKTYLSFFLLFSFTSSIIAQGNKIDSLLNLYQKATDDTNKVNLLSELCLAYSSNEPAKSIQYGNLGLSLSEMLNYPKGTSKIYNDLGNTYEYKGEYDKALDYFQKSLEIRERLGNKESIASVLNNIGTLYFYQGNFPKTLEYFQKTLSIDKELKNNKGIAESLNNIGVVCEAMKDYDKALDNYGQALKIRNEINDKEGIAQSYENIGIVYANQKKLNNTIEYFEKALEIFKSLNNKKEIAKVLGNIGEFYFDLNNYPKAIEYYSSSISTASEINLKNQIMSDYLGLSNTYNHIKDFAKAYEFHKKYSNIKDSIFNETSTEKIAEMDAKYQVEQERKEKELFKKDGELKELQLDTANKQRLYFIIGLALLLLLSGVLYNRFRLKKRSNEKLEKAYHHLEMRQQQLIQQEKLASLGALTAGIAHEIKNPLNFVTNFSQLSKELLEELKSITTEEDRKEIISYLQDNLEKINHHGQRADNIVANMVQHAQGGEGSKQQTNINKLCDEFATIAFQGMRAKNPDFNCELIKTFDEKIPSINIVPQHISKIIFNLLDNSFYAVKKKKSLLVTDDTELADKYQPTVSIKTYLQANHIIINVEDNGTGIPESIRQKIFEPFYTTKPTGDGTGLGLSICNDIVRANGGEMKVESKENEFTRFEIKLEIG